MPISGLRVQKYTPNMAMFGDFDQTEAHFLALPIHVITVSDLTLFITQDVSLIKNKFEHGEMGITRSINTLFTTMHKLRF